jgi:hypothetical protein
MRDSIPGWRLWCWAGNSLGFSSFLFTLFGAFFFVFFFVFFVGGIFVGMALLLGFLPQDWPGKDMRC